MRPLIAKWLRAAARWIDQPCRDAAENGFTRRVDGIGRPYFRSDVMKHDMICDGDAIGATHLAVSSLAQSGRSLAVKVDRFVVPKVNSVECEFCGGKGRIVAGRDAAENGVAATFRVGMQPIWSSDPIPPPEIVSDADTGQLVIRLAPFVLFRRNPPEDTLDATMGGGKFDG